MAGQEHGEGRQPGGQGDQDVGLTGLLSDGVSVSANANTELRQSYVGYTGTATVKLTF